MKRVSFLMVLLSILMLTFRISFASDRYTISGISSGGFMAAQMGVIFSDRIEGVGTVAGGVYFCSKDHFPIHLKRELTPGLFLVEINQDQLMQTPAVFVGSGIREYFKNIFRIAFRNPMYQAVGVCMKQPELAHASARGAPMDLRFVEQFHRQGLISHPGAIRDQRIYAYHGKADDVVGVGMQERMRQFYASFGVSRESLVLETGAGGHNFPTDRTDGIGCASESVPYIANCRNDLAGKMLKHLTGSHEARRVRYNPNNLYKVNQRTPLYTRSVAHSGYLYAPRHCLSDPRRCRLHVALHGCKMSDSYDEAFQKAYEERVLTTGMMHVSNDDPNLPRWYDPMGIASPLMIRRKVPQMGALRFALDSGYGEYAEANDLVILFPQTLITAENFPGNPKGCWDWYGWTQFGDTQARGDAMGKLYATRFGRETRWLNDLAGRVQANPSALILPWRTKAADMSKARKL